MAEKNPEATDNISEWIDNHEPLYLQGIDINERHPEAKKAAFFFKEAFGWIRDRKWRGRTDWAEIARRNRAEDDDEKWAVTAKANRMEQAIKLLTPKEKHFLMTMVQNFQAGPLNISDLSPEFQHHVQFYRSSRLHKNELCIFAGMINKDRVNFRRDNATAILLAAYAKELNAKP